MATEDAMALRNLTLIALVILAVSCLAGAATKTESDILALMATVPKGPHCGTGVEWYRFARQQQDDATLEALRKLYLNHEDERVRRMALSCLSCQKRGDLFAFWDDILKSSNRKEFWLLAVRGLGNINTPASNATLLGILQEPSTPPEVLAFTCHVLSETAPEGGRDAVSPLTRHSSATVRIAAFDAVLALGANTDEVLRQALRDGDASVIIFGLSRLGPNPNMDFVPHMLELLTQAEPKVQAEADEALMYLLSHAAENIAGRFSLLQQALRDNQWDYAKAPLLTSRYAVVLEEKGQLKEANTAYEIAEASFSTNSAYKRYNCNPGATMLYRLFQVKRKMGNLDGTRRILRRMITEYPESTIVYLEDNPGIVGFSSHMEYTVGQVAVRLGSYLDRLPLAVTVVALNATVDASTHPRFRIAIKNITGDVLKLHCTRTLAGDELVPACRPSVVMDARHWMDFEETTFLSGRSIEEVAVKPHESFTFTGTLLPVETKGIHVFDIMLKPECSTGTNSNWSEYVVANSVVVEVK